MKRKSQKQPTNSRANKRDMSKGRSKRNQLQLEADKFFIKDLYLKGYPSREIMVELNKIRDYTLSHVTICEDIKEIKSEMELALTLEVKGHIARALEEIDLDMIELYKAWAKSQSPQTKTVTATIGKKIAGSNKSDIFHINKQTQTAERNGDARFMALRAKLRDQRRAILGLDQQKRQILQDQTGAPQEFVIRLSEKELP